jgi:hypothetical protein
MQRRQFLQSVASIVPFAVCGRSYSSQSHSFLNKHPKIAGVEGVPILDGTDRIRYQFETESLERPNVPLAQDLLFFNDKSFHGIPSGRLVLTGEVSRYDRVTRKWITRWELWYKREGWGSLNGAARPSIDFDRYIRI